MTNTQLRVRRSLYDLQDDYTKGNKKPLEDLIRAWKGITDLPPENHRSACGRSPPSSSAK